LTESLTLDERHDGGVERSHGERINRSASPGTGPAGARSTCDVPAGARRAARPIAGLGQPSATWLPGLLHCRAGPAVRGAGGAAGVFHRRPAAGRAGPEAGGVMAPQVREDLVPLLRRVSADGWNSAAGTAAVDYLERVCHAEARRWLRSAGWL